jgi:hypothetical protein
MVHAGIGKINMRRLLDSDLELLVESGFVYLPLLLDPQIENEIQILHRSEKPADSSGRYESQSLIERKGRHFVRSLNLLSWIANYEAVDPYSYTLLKNECLRKYQLAGEIDCDIGDNKLKTILFQVMPHFIKRHKSLRRGKLSEDEIMDLIGEKIEIPARYRSDAQSFLNLEPLKKILKDLDNRKPISQPPENGLLPAYKLRDWFHEAMHAKVLADERDRVQEALAVRRQLTQKKPDYIATLLYIADRGSIEIDGFGFIRMKSRKDYLLYKRTGEYVLKDYYGRSYLFPDCRVGVLTYPPFEPFVLEKYKHPFLRGYQAGQEICIKGFEAPREFTAEAIIRSLEEGITALVYSYDARRRNGYHTLDKTFVHIPTIVFEEYRI